MPDDRSKNGPADRMRVNVHEDHELRYWCRELGCTEEQLRNSVRQVGVMVADVRRHLGK